MKEVKLVMVSESNSNKFYDMKGDADGKTFTVTYGRVDVTAMTGRYPMSKWDSIYKSKIKKGYKDLTDLFVVEDVNSGPIIEIEDDAIKMFVSHLQQLANNSIRGNYTVSAEKVTDKQLARAQELLNEVQHKLGNAISDLPGYVSPNCLGDSNKILLELYATIPRKMKKVQYHLIGDLNNKERIKNLIFTEQANLDVMSTQVTTLQSTNEHRDQTVLAALGLDMRGINSDEQSTILKQMGEEKGRFVRGFCATNNKTQTIFDNYVKNAINKKTDLFWHGSRNENWWSIINSGLVLRPTNAIISGKMFGYGLYFADRCKKSIGYTSLHGSYWARGSANKGLLSLFEVHLGYTLEIERHYSWCSSLTEKELKRKGNYDSLFAKRGADLYNNEYVVYNEAQTTIKYIVEIN